LVPENNDDCGLAAVACLPAASLQPKIKFLSFVSFI
jgi:hypothetical protein